jgi:hypothetical protein
MKTEKKFWSTSLSLVAALVALSALAATIPISQEPRATSSTAQDDLIINKTNTGAGTFTTKRIAVGDLVPTLSVKTFGATGDGSTDDTSSFQAAANARIPILVPGGSNVYKISNVVLTNGTSFIGNNSRIVMKAGTTGNVLDMGTNSWISIRGLDISGGAANAIPGSRNYTPIGIYVSAYGTNVEVSGCTVHNIDTGIQIAGPGTTGTTYLMPHAKVHDNEAYFCAAGFYWQVATGGNMSEYVIGSQLYAHSCYIGLDAHGGNIQWIGCQATACTYGLYKTGGSNPGHGSIVGCTANHGTWNLYVDAINLGETISGSKFLVGDVWIGNSQGVQIQDCDISDGQLWLNGQGALAGTNYVRFNTAMHSGTVTVIHTNSDASPVYGNFYPDGTEWAGAVYPAQPSGIFNNTLAVGLSAPKYQFEVKGTNTGTEFFGANGFGSSGYMGLYFHHDGPYATNWSVGSQGADLILNVAKPTGMIEFQNLNVAKGRMFNDGGWSFDMANYSISPGPGHIASSGLNLYPATSGITWFSGSTLSQVSDGILRMANNAGAGAELRLGSIKATNSVTSSLFIGNGLQLSNLTAVLAGCILPSMNTTARYCALIAPTVANTTEATYSQPFARAVTLTNLYFKVSNVLALTGTNVTVTVMTNGVASLLAATLVGDGSKTICSNLTDSAWIPAGGTLSLRLVGTNPTSFSPTIIHTVEAIY